MFIPSTSRVTDLINIMPILVGLYGQGEGSLSADLHRDYSIDGNRTFSRLLGISKFGILTFKVGLCHPTGDRTAPSDIDRDFVANGFRHYVL